MRKIALMQCWRQRMAELCRNEITIGDIGVDHSGPARGCAATAHKTPSALRCINAWLVRHFAAQGVNMCQSLDTSVASSVVFSGFGPEMSRVEKRWHRNTKNVGKCTKCKRLMLLKVQVERSDASEGLSCGLKSEAVYLFTAKVGRVTKSSQQKIQALQDLCLCLRNGGQTCRAMQRKAQGIPLWFVALTVGALRKAQAWESAWNDRSEPLGSRKMQEVERTWDVLFVFPHLPSEGL